MKLAQRNTKTEII